MDQTRRSMISALGLALPLGLAARGSPPDGPPVTPFTIRFRPFEEAVREAFRDLGATTPGDGRPCRRVEVGPCEEVLAGLQACHNDRPFAGFPAGHLRIVRAGSEPGSVRRGVRLYVSTVDVVLTSDRPCGGPSRPLDFSTLPPAPIVS